MTDLKDVALMMTHKKAVQFVMRDPLAWDVKTEWGYCGLATKP